MNGNEASQWPFNRGDEKQRAEGLAAPTTFTGVPVHDEVRTAVYDENAARQKFEEVMADTIKDFSRSPTKKAVYVNDRTEGKFQGFYAALRAIARGEISA